MKTQKNAVKHNAERKPSSNRGVRYSEAEVKAIVSFILAGNTRSAAKKKFGCSAHYAGHLVKGKAVKPAKSSAASRAVNAVTSSTAKKMAAKRVTSKKSLL